MTVENCTVYLIHKVERLGEVFPLQHIVSTMKHPFPDWELGYFPVQEGAIKQVVSFYRNNLWKPMKLHRKSFRYDPLKYLIFDTAVFKGEKTTIILVQQALRYMGHTLPITQKLDQKTLRCVRDCDQQALTYLLCALRQKRTLNELRKPKPEQTIKLLLRIDLMAANECC